MGSADTPARGVIYDYGDEALLVEFASTDEVLACTEAVRKARLPGVVDVVPAARTVLVTFDGPRRQTPIRRRLTELCGPPRPWPDAAARPADRIDIDVTYDGPDLREVVRLTGLSSDEVVAAHTANPWRVGFSGFTPGFAYLIGGDERLTVPRRSDPRTKVPTGSVGLAGEFSGVYPRESPGGWQLIGRTDAVLWDATRDVPALLTPGMWVQFRAV